MGPTDRELFEEKLRSAYKILAEYARVMEKHIEGGMLIGESELPAERDAIRASILLVAVHKHLDGPGSPDHLRQARTAYASLAYFVPDETARREEEFEQLAEEALSAIARKEELPAGATEAMVAAPVAELAEAQKRFERLGEAFDADWNRLVKSFAQ